MTTETKKASEAQENRKEEDEEARSEEMRKLLEAKRALRRANLSPERPDAAFFRSLDSSIKRNTAVIKKLKMINEEQREGLLDELKSVNLSKFVTEAVTAICDARLKSSDINAAVQVCSLLHQRYKEFSANLVQGLVKIFLPGKSGEDVDGSSRAIKKRSTLKLLLELYYSGVTDDTGPFVNIVKDLTTVDQRDREAVQTNLSLLVALVRQGRFLIGLPAGSQDSQDELYKELTISPEHKRHLKKMIQTFYDAAVDLLQSEHTALRQTEQDNAKTLNSKGELSDENAAAYEKLRKSYDHLLRNVSALAEAMEIQPPVMPEDTNTTRVAANDGGAALPVGKEPPAPEPIWDDDDTRSFYESLPDLRAFVPAVLLGESEPAKTPDQVDSEASAADSHGTATEAENVNAAAPEEKEKAKEKDRDDADTRKEHDKEKHKFFGDSGNLDSLLQRLPGAVSRDLIDQLTVDFCYLNSKSNRKKLVRTLFNVPRTSLELLPYYSRMVATLSSCMRDIGPMIVQHLEEEFNFLISKKDQMNIETKIKNIRFLGELAKFRVAPTNLIFSCLKACLDDFAHHNIDVACNLLESCGRFLYRSPETCHRMSNMLETFARLKNVKNLDARHSTLVENAYYQCKPPERSAKVSKTLPEPHQYIKKLIMDLDLGSVNFVNQQVQKLPESEHFVLKCFMKVHKLKYNQVPVLASLAAMLKVAGHDTLAVAVVDEVLEEIRVGLEMNDFGMQQRRIAFIRFLGEIYNYQLIDHGIIFDTLYLIIFFGEGTPEQASLDPPEDFFRIRLVTTLLETCGAFFDRGPARKKLDRFLLFFQRYILAKGPIPLDVEFDLQDLFASLRPKMIRYTSFEEAHLALVEMERGECNSSAEYSVQGGVVPVENGVDEPESDTQSSDEGSDEEEASEDDEDDTVENSPGSEEDDPVMLRRKSKEIDPAEDADFEKELRAMIQESGESRKLEARVRPSSLNLMVPVSLEHGKSVDVESGDETVDEQGSAKEVKFRVLMKKGNKHQWKHLPIPRDSTLVQSSKQKEAAELEEKQDIKRLVLEYNEREVDDRTAAAAQPLNWSSRVSVNPGRGTGGRGGGWDGRQKRPLPTTGYGRTSNNRR